MACRDKLWSFCISPPRLDRFQQNVETNYGHSASYINHEEQIRQYQDDVSVLIIFNFLQVPLAGRFTGRVVFRSNEISVLSLLPFISNKRQVKRGNCHTLISSGDHPSLGCDPRLTSSRYLAPIIRQFVKFRDMPEVKRKHCSTIREVLRHAGNEKDVLVRNP